MVIDEIAKDLYRISVPLPMTSLKSVNSYVVKDRERNMVIDTGVYNDDCFDAMQVAFKELGIDLQKTDFFVTHCHTDQNGLICRFISDGSYVSMNLQEAGLIRKFRLGTIFSEMEEFIDFTGFPEKDPRKILTIPEGYLSRETNACHLWFVEDADIIERGDYRFMCIETKGHSNGHMCLYEPEKKFLISGDHLLKDDVPSIRGRIGDKNVLTQYLSSLDKVEALDVDMVLPGHGDRFGNCKERINELKNYHMQKKYKIISVLQTGGKNVYQTASQMVWDVRCDSWDSLSLARKFLATGETYAYLEYLEKNGEIERTMKRQTAVYSLREVH
jgi:glyoxylase-like metal-dependent hydrolase (beta-lactamase superfamily II)